MSDQIDFTKIEFTHPRISFSEKELKSLKKDWKNQTGPRYEFLKSKQDALIETIDNDIYYPPEGGNHNQWYQCEPCQYGLTKKGDDEHLCEKCNTTYHGQPYIGVIYRSKHVENFWRMYTASILFHLEDEIKYFDYAKKILIGYAKRYSTYEYHDNMNNKGEEASKSGGRILPQTLDEAVNMCTYIAPSFDLIYNELSKEEIKLISSDLIKPMITSIQAHSAGISNWQSWHNDGLLYGGYVLEDIDLINQSITDKENGFLFQLDHSVNEAGMWYENSWAYHNYAISALTYFLNGTNRIGISFWDHQKVKSIYEAPLKFKLSNGDLPRIGDGLESNLNNTPEFYSAAYASLPNKSKISELLPNSVTFENLYFKFIEKNAPKKELHESSLIESAGMVILRNNNNNKKLGVSLNFAEFGGFHGHFDKLSFTLHAYDQELGVDPGRSESQAYRLPIHREWYRSTFSHNTIMINSEDQEGVEAELINYANENDYSYAIIRSDKMYPGSKIIRNAVLTGNYLLLFDQINCEKESDIDWLYHNHGQITQTPENTPAELNRILGNKYINDLSKTNPRKSGLVNFKNNNTNLSVHFKTSSESILYTGNGLYRSTAHRVPMMLLSGKGTLFNFLTILEPLKSNEKSKIDQINFTDYEGYTNIQLTNNKSKEFIAINNSIISFTKES